MATETASALDWRQHVFMCCQQDCWHLLVITGPCPGCACHVKDILLSKQKPGRKKMYKMKGSMKEYIIVFALYIHIVCTLQHCHGLLSSADEHTLHLKYLWRQTYTELHAERSCSKHYMTLLYLSTSNVR
jgi:hypothetical protein